jgi:hypothetical protein
VGLLEEIDKLELSDEQKATLRTEYGVEVGSKDDEITALRRRNRKDAVEAEISELGALFSDAPGLLKFVRRVYLSDDEQPGMVLLSDDDLELEGDQRTGARTEEDITTAAAIREFIQLLPRNSEGKLALSDQALITGDHDAPDRSSGDVESDEQKVARRDRVAGVLGRPVERNRTRFQGSVS